MKSKTTFLIILTVGLFLNYFANASEFITRWDMNVPGNAVPNQLMFNAFTTGVVSYTWETIPAGTSGFGTFTGTTVTINGIPSNSIIRLKIDSANMTHFYMNMGADRSRLKDIEQWGTIVWSSMNHSFAGCNNLNITATDLPNLSNVTDLSHCFNGCTILNGPTNINNWDVSSVTNMSYLFGLNTTFNQPIGNWDVSNVTDMSSMFFSASNFNQAVGNWDISNVTNLQGTFWQASNFNQPIGNWNTINVLTMELMFQYATSFNQPIGNWNTSNVNDMTNMFAYASNFNQSIGNWDVSNVTALDGMFNYASAFNQPIGNWNVSNVTNMTALLVGASSFNQSLGNWTLNQNVILLNTLAYCGINCANYSQTLNGWANNPACPSNRTLGSVNRQYGNNAIADRTYLDVTKGWTITGDLLNTSSNCCFTKYKTVSINACNSYTFNNQMQTVSGTYYDSLLTVNGCDSIVTLNLTINTIDTTITQSGATLSSNENGAIYQWLSCPAYSIIIGATSQTYSAISNGNYAVSITNNSCTDTSNCISVTSVGTNNLYSLNEILINPNPTNGNINMSLQGVQRNSLIKVLNLTGQTMLTKELNSINSNIDISTFANGIYYFEIVIANKLYRTKLVKI